jgi:hypothetical protein
MVAELVAARTVEVDAGGWGVFVVILFAFLMVVAIASLVLWVWALVDAIQVPNDSMYRSGTKLVWVLVIVFLQVIGAVIYLVVGRPTKGPSSLPSSQARGLPPPPP